MFLYTIMVNNPVLYAAIMTLWLVALPGFLTVSGVSIVSVMCLVVPAAPSLLTFGSVDAVIIAVWAQCNPYYKI
jgi:hypothetical protein